VAALLDASSLLAYLHDEAGADVVTDAIAQGDTVMSVVNWSETLSKWADLDEDPAHLAQKLEEEGLIGGTVDLIPVTPEDAVAIAQLRPLTRDLGLSLGDRTCIATAIRLGFHALTADRTWADVELEGFSVQLIR
jgi:ribonuclease VapC